SVRVMLDGGASIAADQVLVATGRAPRTDDLGLEHVGLPPGSWLDVDDSLRVRSVRAGWLYAAGDLNHHALLTHMGQYQARICGDASVARGAGGGGAENAGAWTRWTATADHAAVPQVVFTEPEVAAVGLTAEQARSCGMRVRAIEYDLGRVAGASLYA